jgi:hypothetical protein
MVEYEDSQTDFDSDFRPSPDSHSLHTQPDSSGEKSKRLHIQDDDDGDESYSNLQSSQTSEHPSELCHPGQHLDHVEGILLDNLGVSDLVPKTSYESPPFDTDKLKTALHSIEKQEPGSWNLNDELERTETTKPPGLSFQKVNGNEKKKGTCGAEQKETC